MPELTREQFAQEVVRRVRARFPLVDIARSAQPFSLRINGSTASLENLYRIAQLRPEDMQYQIERWAVELLRASEGTPDREADYREVADRVLPILMNSATEGKRLQTLAGQPLIADLHLVYVLDGDRTIAYIPVEALQRWEVSVDALHEKAMDNLVARSQNMTAQAAPSEGGQIDVLLFQLLDGYDASRLLLPALHSRLREHLGSPFCAAVPNRDILLCFRDEQPIVERVREQVRADYRTMPHQVSDRILLVTADGLAAYR